MSGANFNVIKWTAGKNVKAFMSKEEGAASLLKIAKSWFGWGAKVSESSILVRKRRIRLRVWRQGKASFALKEGGFQRREGADQKNYLEEQAESMKDEMKAKSF